MSEPTLSSQTIPQLCARMADTRPGPSAGSAAALALGMAAGLTAKTARLSSRTMDGTEAIAQEADGLRVRAVELAEADAAAVRAMLTGGGGPETINVPEAIGDVATQVGGLAQRLYAEGNPRMRADALAAVQLARAAGATVEEILHSNRPSSQDDTSTSGQPAPE